MPLPASPPSTDERTPIEQQVQAIVWSIRPYRDTLQQLQVPDHAPLFTDAVHDAAHHLSVALLKLNNALVTGLRQDRGR